MNLNNSQSNSNHNHFTATFIINLGNDLDLIISSQFHNINIMLKYFCEN